MNIISFNVRGMGRSKKKRVFERTYTKEMGVGMVYLQETMTECINSEGIALNIFINIGNFFSLK